MSVFRTLLHGFGVGKPSVSKIVLGRSNEENWTPSHRHSKGGMYRELARGILEANHQQMVVYDDADGNIWIRPVIEFDDGRFTPVA